MFALKIKCEDCGETAQSEFLGSMVCSDCKRIREDFLDEMNREDDVVAAMSLTNRSNEH